MNAPYARLETLEPGIARVLAHNPSAFTYYGTQTYLAGEREVAVIDPGPNLSEHVEALLGAVGGRKVVAIMCTHTHRDHSPAARPLANVTGAPIIGWVGETFGARWMLIGGGAVSFLGIAAATAWYARHHRRGELRAVASDLRWRSARRERVRVG